jgi:hypothetical protein
MQSTASRQKKLRCHTSGSPAFPGYNPIMIHSKCVKQKYLFEAIANLLNEIAWTGNYPEKLNVVRQFARFVVNNAIFGQKCFLFKFDKNIPKNVEKFID